MGLYSGFLEISSFFDLFPIFGGVRDRFPREPVTDSRSLKPELSHGFQGVYFFQAIKTIR